MIIPSFVLPEKLPITTRSGILLGSLFFIEAITSQKGSNCPLCDVKSYRVHSKYGRKLLDFPISGKQVYVKLTARKFFCDNDTCNRKIFTERFSNEILPYNRRFVRSDDLLFRIAIALGGNSGANISNIVGMSVSSSTLLRIIGKNQVIPQETTSGIIGVDDWAFKKGNTYGTIVVDLSTKKVIDLLPDRKANTLSNWLKTHPEVKVISRDRYGPYALGAKSGAPQAIQVADRFHLLMNLGEATKKMLQSKGKTLKEMFRLYNNPSESKIVNKIENQNIPSPNEDSTTNINPVLQFKFNQVKEFRAKGYSIKHISRTLKMHRQTIKKYLTMDELPKKSRHKTTNFESFQQILLHPENKNKNYMELFKQIVPQGYNGCYSQFCVNMKVFQNQYKIEPDTNSLKTVALHKIAPIKIWSTNRLSMLMYFDRDTLKKDDRDFLALLYKKNEDIKQTGEFISRFKNLFIEKKDGLLKQWIQDVTESESGIKTFAKNLAKDYDAVNNSVITPYSNGQVEGQVNKLKNIKRSMYGRASFPLLRKMVLFNST